MNNFPHIIISGGALVGTTTALALSAQGFQVTLLDQRTEQARTSPGTDGRILALSYASRCFFEKIGVWSSVAPFSTPIKHVHVANSRRFGGLRLRAKEANIEALGYMVCAESLNEVLLTLLKETSVTILSPATLNSFSTYDDRVEILFQQEGVEKKLSANLLIAADGAQSSIRQQLQLPIAQHDFQQKALLAQVSITRDHCFTAYERCTPDGVIALLPLHKNRSALIWTTTTTNADKLFKHSDRDFLNLLYDTFGNRLGKITEIFHRKMFPLTELTNTDPRHGRIVLLGNAHHVLHPIGAQGFNLALRSIASLSHFLQSPDTPISDDALQKFSSAVQADCKETRLFTNSIVDILMASNPFATAFRQTGFALLGACPPVKRWLARRALRSVHLSS
jgi:2-octaprenyl-6-methoxyphenol hydroxylase